MLPALVLTVGGKTGPETRSDVMAAVRAFEDLYHCSPRVLTVMPEGLRRLAQLARDGAEAFEAAVIAQSRPAAAEPVEFCGLRLTVGPAYQLTD